MKIKELLTEHVVNLWNQSGKEKYGREVWDMLQSSYEKVGGFKTAASLQELIEKSGLWKLITRDGKVSAVKIYKDSYGRKSIGMGSNGTYQGKKDLFMIMKDDVKFRRAWSEISGMPEILFKKFGGKPISSDLAKFLTKKEILSYDPDGFHYTRLISGEPKEKIIYGFVNLSLEDKIELEKHGINLHFLQ